MCMERMKKERKRWMNTWYNSISGDCTHRYCSQHCLERKRERDRKKDRFLVNLERFFSAYLSRSTSILKEPCVRYTLNTHTAAANEDNAETLQHPSSSHHPRQPQEQDHTKDVLQTWQVNSHKRPHLWRLQQVGRGDKNQLIVSDKIVNHV